METMKLTEQQIEDRDELFFTIISNFIEENYEVADDYEMTEDDAYITSLVMEYFEDNFKYPTLQESLLEEITGYDINTPLYEEIGYILLDETVGTFVAGAAHGIRNFLSNVKSKKATYDKNKAKSKFDTHTVNPGSKSKPKLKADVAQKNHDNTNYGGGVTGTIKKSYQQGKITALKQRADKAKEAMKNAESKRKSALGKHQSNIGKTGQLANKIDTGISNVKNRVKQAITVGASRIGAFLGKASGAIVRPV